MISRLETYGAWLSSDPAGFVMYIIYFVVAILLSLILHECAHGWVALRCGDPTAQMLGRLTLDPRKHLDPLGTVLMFLLGFGWAKPVPVNPRNFRNYRRDEYLVSIAGIVVNFSLFLICTGLSVLVNRLMVGANFFAMYDSGIEERHWLFINLSNSIAYGGASLPADLTSYMAMPWLQYIQRFLVMMRTINLSLAVFNLLPIPPLDGFQLVNHLLRGRLRITQQVFEVTRIVLMVVCLTGVLGRILSTVTSAVDGMVTRAFLML